VLRVAYEFLFAWLAILAGIATLILFRRDYFGKAGEEGKIAIIFIGVFAIVFFLYALGIHVRWGRAVRYGSIISYVNQGFGHVHAANRDSKATSQRILDACRSLCDNIASAFSLLTSSPCSVSIKVFATPPTGRPEVRISVLTMCRDSQSSGMRDYRTSNPHWLDENTDFRSILENISKPGGRFFFSNQLPFYYGYRNTSFATYGEPEPSNIPVLSAFLRYWRWPLPYQSTIVCPICPGISSQRVLDNLIGFLCVDSPRMGAFRRSSDPEILVGIADGIFTAIVNYMDLKERESQ
jgi:hypothetical protein